MYTHIQVCFMDMMHRLMIKISDDVRITVLRKRLYQPTANMNFLRNPSVLVPPFLLFTRNSYDRPPNKRALSVLQYQGSGQGDITPPITPYKMYLFVP